MTKTEITGYHIYHSFLAGYMNIAEHREHLNRINLFPVPDGDTGNNMVRTFKAIVRNLRSSRSAGRTLERISDISLENARGNSGIIVSQYLSSLSSNAGLKSSYSPGELGLALKKAASDTYTALDQPVEGTILTVLRTWAETIHNEGKQGRSFIEVMSLGLSAARKALAETTRQLKVLKENNVVDAGAMGFVRFLEGIDTMYKKGPVPLVIRRKLEDIQWDPQHIPEEHLHSPKQDLKFRYCTEVLLDQISADPDEIKNSLRELGDSLIVSGGERRVRIHIHSNEPGKVVETARLFGKAVQQKADDMFRQEQAVYSRTGKIAVLTDSIADIPQEILDTYQIHVLNLKLLWDDDEFLDRLTISPETFYQQQKTRKSFPGSSVPERARVENLFQFLLEHYEGIIALPVARALSGTWQQMKSVAEAFNRTGERIITVDTCLNSAAQGLLVSEIAEAANRGLELFELAELAEDLKKRIRIYVSVNTFKYMVKGGRVSPLKGFLASALNLKPIVTLDQEGRGKAFDKSFSQHGLLSKITKIVQETERTRGILRYAVVHALAERKAETFASIVEGITGLPPYYITSISPIVGMHSGEGAVAIAVLEAPPR